MKKLICKYLIVAFLCLSMFSPAMVMGSYIPSLVNGNLTVTVTEQEPMVAGDIAIAAGTDAIPFSSLDNLIVTTVGGELDNVIGGNDTNMAVDWISDNVAVCAYADASDTSKGNVTSIKYEADGSVIVGSKFIFDVNATEVIDIASINNGRFILIWVEGVVQRPEAMAVQLHPETLGMTFGAVSQLEAVDSDALAVCQAADDKFCVIYADATNSDGNLIAGTVNSSTLAITLGSKVSIGAGDISNVSITKVTTDKIACAYRDIGAADDGFCNIATLSGTVITAGGDTEYIDAVTVAGTAITALTTSLIVIVSKGITGNNNPVAAWAATISGTTPTFGSQAQLSEATDVTAFPQVAPIDDTYFLALWDNSDDSKTGFSISSISGNAVTAGTRKYMWNDIPSNVAGRTLKINSYNDVVFFGKTGSATYAVMMDIGWKDGTYTLDDILGVAEDANGVVIVDGIDEGNASGQDPSMTYFWDGQYRCVRQKNHSNQFPGYIPRVRVVAPDALRPMSGY